MQQHTTPARTHFPVECRATPCSHAPEFLTLSFRPPLPRLPGERGQLTHTFCQHGEMHATLDALGVKHGCTITHRPYALPAANRPKTNDRWDAVQFGGRLLTTERPALAFTDGLGNLKQVRYSTTGAGF